MGFGSKKLKDESDGQKTIHFKVKNKCERCGKISTYKLKFTGKPGERWKGNQIKNCLERKCAIAVIIAIDVTVK